MGITMCSALSDALDTIRLLIGVPINRAAASFRQRALEWMAEVDSIESEIEKEKGEP